MRYHLLFAAAAVCAVCACNQSDTRKLTDDAKATGKVVEKTATDALGAAKNTTDNIVDDTRKAADSPTAQDLKNKASNATQKAIDKTKQVAHDAKDAATPAPKQPPPPQR